MVCALPQVRAVPGLFLFSGCELGIGIKSSAQCAAKPYVVETEDWDAAANIPLLVPSRGFIALKLQLVQRAGQFLPLRQFVDLQHDREIFLTQIGRLGLELMLQLAQVRLIGISGFR